MIVYLCVKSRQLTIDQIKVCRKTLAYSYEQKGGKKGETWPSVKGLMATIKISTLPQKIKEVLAVNIPSPKDLKFAFTQGWTTENAWHFVPWCLGLIAAYDAHILGCLAIEDHRKIKKSITHEYNWKNGWQCTRYFEGRAKLTGIKKGTRPWWVWRVCMCPGNRHVRPPPDFHAEIDADGDPKCKKIVWCSTCPLAAVEIIWQLQLEEDESKRCYPKWLPKSMKRAGRLGRSNEHDIAKLANRWMHEAQGLPIYYDHNAGRKSLARWCGHLLVPYCESVHIHGDLHQVWGRNYQEDVPKSVYSIRNQSREPEKACKALRRLAKWFGTGLPYEVKQSKTDRYMDAILRSIGQTEWADKIKMEMPDDDTDEDSEQPVKRKRRKEEVEVKGEVIEKVKDED